VEDEKWGRTAAVISHWKAQRYKVVCFSHSKIYLQFPAVKKITLMKPVPPSNFWKKNMSFNAMMYQKFNRISCMESMYNWPRGFLFSTSSSSFISYKKKYFCSKKDRICFHKKRDQRSTKRLLSSVRFRSAASSEKKIWTKWGLDESCCTCFMYQRQRERERENGGWAGE